MKSNEFLTEQVDPLTSDESCALPATFILPDLKNQDAYLQYRFGLALASARAVENGDVTFKDTSQFGENMVVVARSEEEVTTLSAALKMFGTHNRSIQIANAISKEAAGTAVVSPIPQNSGKKLNRKS